LAVFAGEAAQGGGVLRDGFEVAAGQGAGPRWAWAQALEICQRLPGQWEESADGLPARKAERHQDARGGFDDGEDVTGGESAGGVVSGLGSGRDDHGPAAEVAADAASGAQGGGSAFDRADASVERRYAASAERLQGMQRAGGGAEAFERLENAAVESAVGVKHYFTGQFSAPLPDIFAAPFPGDTAATGGFPAEARQRFGDGGDGAIGSGDEDDVGSEQARIQARVRAAAADGAGGGAGVLRGAADDGADAPALLAEAAREGAAYAACADDGESGLISWHQITRRASLHGKAGEKPRL